MTSRREFIGGMLAFSALPGLCGDERKLEYHAFSRVFQFLKDPYMTADFLKSCGYDGVEWTVRNGGFLDPVKASPKKMKALKSAADKAGIKAENIVVDYLRGGSKGSKLIDIVALIEVRQAKLGMDY